MSVLDVRIPTINNNRFYTNKEIDLVSLLPNKFRDSEIQTFLTLFQTYLNEMYEGTSKYISPENLSSITYAKELVWTNHTSIITAPYGNLLDYFESGDYVRRNNDTKYYKIKQVIDNSTIELIEDYMIENPGYFKTAFWDEFTGSNWNEFYDSSSSVNVFPVGMDGTFMNTYKRDLTNNRVIAKKDSPDYSIFATKIKGEYEFEFNFHRSENSDFRGGEFGFSIKPENTNTLVYSCYYLEDKLYLRIKNEDDSIDISCDVELDDDENDWIVNVKKSRTTGKIKFTLLGLRKKEGSTLNGFTPILGYFNRFEYSMDIPVIDTFDNYTELGVTNSESQGWNYFYFLSDYGFPGEIDNLDYVSDSPDVDDSLHVKTGLLPRTHESDGTSDVYSFYNMNGFLRIRNLSTTFVATETEFKKAKNHISVLEKIRRLSELHDPDLIDLEYIQYYCNYVGYNININRDTIGIFLSTKEENWEEMNYEEQQDLVDKYLRFIITSLPSWYKIKTTNDALRIMLYSFGLITDIKHYFCTKYSDFNTFVLEGSGNVLDTEEITDEHYKTPHFAINVNIDSSIDSFYDNPERMRSIIEAILSVKPINTVFRGLVGVFMRKIDSIYVSANMYTNVYSYLK
jgi:hypothetical protein